ncbi:MAG: DNA gyrase inhibitor YacG [Planctomycetales bacterium]|nr:DNA gyrase inhibitor YacG [Planctomycetales bacterium]
MVRLNTCPICGKTVPPATDPSGGMAPFCSQRCREIDFFRWSDGRYAIVESLSADDVEIKQIEASASEAQSEE